MRYYEQLTYFPGHTGGELAVIEFPSRSVISRVVVTGPTSFNLTVYNRNIAPAAVDLARIGSDADGQAVLSPAAVIRSYFRVGDTVTVADNSVAGYNTNHVITAINAAGDEITTDQAYTAGGAGGTVVPALTTAEKKLFEIIAQTAASGGVAAPAITKDIVFVNQDSEYEINKWRYGKLYLLLSANGDYRVAIAGGVDIS